ncbi:hypothetical protein [Streptomyces sp. CO7]
MVSDAWIRVLAVADQADAPSDVAKMLTPFAQYGIVGAIVVLLIWGILVPKYVMTALTSDRDNWRTAYEREREAHEVTRQQLAAAQASADAATEQGRAIVQLLDKLGHRTDNARSA